MNWNRRSFIAAAFGSAAAAQQQQQSAARDWSGQQPLRYPDPDVVALDPRFRKYMVNNTPIRRLHTGTLWAEGPAWNGVGKYLVWSDIPNNVQMRWIEDDARISVFRNPSGYSNGNTFDYEGRELSCDAWSAMNITARPPSSPTNFKASGSIRPTIS
jgi:gluconolactonase